MDIDKTVDYRREEGYKTELKRIVLDAVEGAACRVFLFGSRVTNRIKRSSDFDIGVVGLDAKSFGAVKRAIEDEVEESSIPHGVDVVDFETADDHFRSVATEEIEVWKDARIT
ncbi:MAG: nucleotidyltransferase domain-containing protein [Rectinemataceae bacterium]